MTQRGRADDDDDNDNNEEDKEQQHTRGNSRTAPYFNVHGAVVQRVNVAVKKRYV